jgi:hypothetical protein
MELYNWDEPPVEAAAAGDPSPMRDFGGPGSIGLGGDSDGTGAVIRRQRILVLGPPDLVKTKRAVRLGMPIEPETGWEASLLQLEELPFTRSGLLGQRFFPQFADALAKGEVAAALVQAVLQPASEASGFAGGGTSAAALGGPPSGAAGTPGDMGGAAAGATGWHGAPVPLDDAAPLTRERFLELVGNQSGTP